MNLAASCGIEMWIVGPVSDRLRAFREKIGGSDRDRFARQVSRDNSAFDAKYGTETAGAVLLSEYDVPEEVKFSASPYEGVHETVLRTIIEALVPNPEEYDFVDVGAGKGKALLVASTYPFQRVRGVELSPSLHERAVRNIEIFTSHGHAKCQDVLSCCMDGRKFSDFGSKTLLFLGNPFDEGLMREFVSALEEESKAAGRLIVVAYLVPRNRRPFDDSLVFKCVFETKRLCVYRNDQAELTPKVRDRLFRRFESWNPSVLR